MKNDITNPSPEDVKTDLKHDTMEFSAATEGDDKLDSDDAGFEEDEISIDELDALEDDDLEDQEAALDSVEEDVKDDEDVMPEEDWTDDLPDNDEPVNDQSLDQR